MLKNVSEKFQSFMLQNGILHQTSYVDTPHNGLADFCAFYVELHTQFHVSIQSLRSDNAKECLRTISIIHVSK